MGINTSKLAGKLIELLHHCHLITILLLELAPSQGYEQLSSSLRTTLRGISEFVAGHLEKCRSDKPKMGLLLKEMCTFAVLWKDCRSITSEVKPLIVSAVEVLENSSSVPQNKPNTHEVIDLDLDFGEVEDATPQKNNEEEILMSCVEFVALGAQDQELVSHLDFDLSSKLRSFSESSTFQCLPLSLRLQWHLCYLEVCGSMSAIEMTLTFLMNLFENGVKDMRFFLPITYCKMIGLVSFAGRLLSRAMLPLTLSGSTAPSDQAIETCEMVVNIIIAELKENRLNWAHRLCLSDCLAVFIEAGPSYSCSNEPCESLMQWENVFLHLIRDNDFRVRRFMSRSISILFGIYENTEALYLDVERRLGVVQEKQTLSENSQDSHQSLLSQTEEELKTMLLSLAEILCSCDVNEERILLIFVSVASINTQTNRTVVSLLDEVAKRSRFPSRVEFLKNSLSQIVSLWIGGTDVHSPRTIFEFPWNLLESTPSDTAHLTGASLANYVVCLPPLSTLKISFS